MASEMSIFYNTVYVYQNIDYPETANSKSKLLTQTVNVANVMKKNKKKHWK